MNGSRRSAGFVLSFAAVIMACCPLLGTIRGVEAQTVAYQGFGAETPGGSGGAVVRVTNLADSGPGSLREALSAGNRTVVFDVGGDIVLSSAIRIKGAFITIDGFTAPGGITLRGAGLSIQGSSGAHDIIVRGIRIRDATATESTDGITIAFGAYNIVIDHVSICCSADGNLDITYDSHDVTVSWSILAGTGKNMLIKYNASRVSLHHNILTESLTRNPQVRIDDAGAVASDTTLDMRNNIVWSWGTGYGTLVWHGPQANIVNNYYSPDSDAISVSEARAFVQGNFTTAGVELDGLSTEATPFPAPPVTTEDAWVAASDVLAGAGVRPLDAVDAAYLAAITLPVWESDLAVIAVTNPPTSVTTGGGFAVTDTVVNQGIGPVETSTVRYYLAGSTGALPLGSRVVPELDAGASSTGTVTVTVPSTVPVGTYHLLACADDTGVVTESSEVNNCRTSAAAVQVGAPPSTGADLVVAEMQDPPSTATAGGTFGARDWVLNQGVLAAGPSVTRYYLSLDLIHGAGDALLVGSRTVSSLSPGQTSKGSISVTIPPAVPAGLYYLLACADDTSAVAESNETNNCRASTIPVLVAAPAVTGTVDLTVSALAAPPASALPGASLSVTDTVVNQGTVGAGPSSIRYYLSLDPLRDAADALLVGTRSVLALAAGASSTGTASVTVPATLPAGTYYLLACADDAGAVAESSETNNCRASASPVQMGAPQPTGADLVVTEMFNPPATASPGGTFGARDWVLNQGTATAAPSVTRYYLSLDSIRDAADILLEGGRSVSSLTPGQTSKGSIAVTIPPTAAAAAYYLIACAEDAGTVAESSEINNCRVSTTLVVVGP